MPTAPAPEDRLSRLSCVAWHGRGVGRIATLPALLDGWRLVPAARARAEGAQAVLAWGRKPSARRAEAWAARLGLPVLWLEDGFLRSVGLGADEPPLSVVLDDQGIYYDAHGPSRLEALVRLPLTEARRSRADDLCRAWRGAHASKYNQSREWTGTMAAGDVLVVDQTAGDASIAGAMADTRSFQRMLEAALDEHPSARIWLKVHPDVVAGRKRGHFDRLTPGQQARVTVLGEPVHPAGLLAQATAVYVVSSQMGFEALLWGRPVRCFGMPFYAGWGLTRDELVAPARRLAAELPALVHAALADYPRYADPETGEPTSPERLLDWIGLQRRQRERFPAELMAVGFSGWKRASLQRFMAGSRIRSGAPAEARRFARPVVLWGRQAWPEAASGRVLRVEDGFLRSVGLGADLVQPLSWAIDGRGLHYDARRPSDLEHLLAEGHLDEGLLQRARALRERLVASDLTKYNVGQGDWRRPATDRPVVLVVGQVESDASLALGAPGLHTNLGLLQAVRRERPEAWIVYRPHPDVSARLRAPGQDEDTASRWCDEVVAAPPITALLAQVDEVHVLTSLAGFEALLRGVRVVCWGVPFYAGWGLTVDRVPTPRRGRLRSLDELVAAALFCYPTYVSRRTGHFTSPEGALAELLGWREQAAMAPAPGPWARGWQTLRRAVLREWVAWRRRRVANECEISRFESKPGSDGLQAGDGKPPVDP
ncbi:capsular polysaccharide biosynthesis protein [Ideonella oryzae]|uniref:Capsular polysaccharide biosynthesis protein n=1 Tax=Ideonella oryzae TaxID=2937441 RepID=A0ABT1BMV4_9BURK|nr:capsular polysaccharide biosynthesis protein [Ideonella oryzae]MCO5977530.1 capsular polysaccharide biosynthesis protein [Ideonella oryzae]